MAYHLNLPIIGGANRSGVEDAAPQSLHAYLSTAVAGRGERRLALAVVLLSAVCFAAAIPFARVPLPKVPAFISSYESALLINDLITAILLFSQFSRRRSLALLALASGYLFDALMIIPHALTFPGLFAPTGLLGAGAETTAWLYVFWHGGFPLFVLAYAALGERAGTAAMLHASSAIALAVGGVIASVGALTLLATTGHDLLPVIIRDNNFSLLVAKGVSPAIWTISLVALLALWRRRKRAILDLWLMVVMCVWLFDIALSAVVSSTRYDLGWYAGRTYGLMAASFVLAVLLIEVGGLQRRLAEAKAEVEDHAHALEARVRERTTQLARSNEALKAEIAEKRQTEQELVRTRAFLNVIIENIPGILLVKGAEDRKTVLVNRAAEQLIGRDRREIVGRTVHDLLPEDEAKLIDVQDTRALQSGSALETHEHSVTTRNQGLRLVRTKKTLVLDEENKPRYLVSISEDITEQRQTEDQLRQAQKMEAIGQLTGGLAHDFNNHLAIIIGNLDVLHELRHGNPEEDELLQDALEAALRGGELTRRLLAFARRQPLRPERVDVNNLIGGITKLLGRTLGESIEVTLVLDPAIPAVVADPAQLETAIANLANNARDAMPKGGHLTITTGNRYLDEDYAAGHAEVASGDYVMIEVGDAGVGMPADVLERIFEPFYTTKGPGKGTGLGLSMVFGFMKQSGGHINVYSEPGQGTIFRLYLRPADASPAASAGDRAPLERARGGGETILVVEDSAKLRRVVVKQLTEFGYAVLEAENGRAALEVINSGTAVDLLFSDIVMPGDMDGFALARAFVAHCPNARVLLTSGFPGTRLVGAEGLKASVCLLSKPYRKDELARAVREAIDNREPPTRLDISLSGA